MTDAFLLSDLIPHAADRAPDTTALTFTKQWISYAELALAQRNFANGVIGLARERYTKNLWTDRASEQRPLLVTVKDGVDQGEGGREVGSGVPAADVVRVPAPAGQAGHAGWHGFPKIRVIMVG